MENLVSIIMPSYNTAQFIAESINSVLSQTHENWELIIVDDCSTDNTDDVVKPFLEDNRIKYIKNEINSGAAVSRNKALLEAKGDYVAFLDSDDLWEDNKLEHQLSFMKQNNYDFSYTNYERISEDGTNLNVLCTGPKVVTKRKMYHYCYPGCLTVMYKREGLENLQIKDIKKNNDYAMWLYICKNRKCYLLNENLAKYRVRKKSVSHDKFFKKLKSHYQLFRICDERSSLAAFWFASWNMWFGFWKKITFEKK